MEQARDSHKSMPSIPILPNCLLNKLEIRRKLLLFQLSFSVHNLHYIQNGSGDTHRKSEKHHEPCLDLLPQRSLISLSRSTPHSPPLPSHQIHHSGNREHDQGSEERPVQSDHHLHLRLQNRDRHRGREHSDGRSARHHHHHHPSPTRTAAPANETPAWSRKWSADWCARRSR